MLECHKSLGDWEGLIKFREENTKANFPILEVEYPYDFLSDIQYVKSMVSFERGGRESINPK